MIREQKQKQKQKQQEDKFCPTHSPHLLSPACFPSASPPAHTVSSSPRPPHHRLTCLSRKLSWTRINLWKTVIARVRGERGTTAAIAVAVAVLLILSDYATSIIPRNCFQSTLTCLPPSHPLTESTRSSGTAILSLRIYHSSPTAPLSDSHASDPLRSSGGGSESNFTGTPFHLEACS